MPDVAGAVVRGVEGDFRDRLVVALSKKHQLNLVCMAGENREIDPVRPRRGAEGPAMAPGGRKCDRRVGTLAHAFCAF